MTTTKVGNLDRLCDLSSGYGPRSLQDEIEELRNIADAVAVYREAVDALVEADQAFGRASGSDERNMLWSELISAGHAVRAAADELPKDVLAALGWIEL